jgi:hypothetical protein
MAYKTPDFHNFVLEQIKEFKTPGLSLAVVQGDEIYSKVKKPLSTRYMPLTRLRHSVTQLYRTLQSPRILSSTWQALPRVQPPELLPSL